MKSAFLNQIWLLVSLAISPSAAIPQGLIHHWNFDEGPDWHDSAFGSVCTNTMAWDYVSGANATLQNMGSSNWVSGRQFRALEFDGVNQYLAIATNLTDTLGGYGIAILLVMHDPDWSTIGGCRPWHCRCCWSERDSVGVAG
jgi:hypothetical protein